MKIYVGKSRKICYILHIKEVIFVSKVISNIGLDADLKRESQKLYSDLF